jgi:hypothetical protein
MGSSLASNFSSVIPNKYLDKIKGRVGIAHPTILTILPSPE